MSDKIIHLSSYPFRLSNFAGVTRSQIQSQYHSRANLILRDGNTLEDELV